MGRMGRVHETLDVDEQGVVLGIAGRSHKPDKPSGNR